MSHTALITGATGLLGREVTKSFKQAGWLTVGQGLNRAAPPTILKANLEDPADVKRILDEAKYVTYSESYLDIVCMVNGLIWGCLVIM